MAKMKTVFELNGHTKECNVAALHTMEAREAFLEKYPNVCRSCGGSGEVEEYNYPYEPNWVDSCGKCVELGICPLCGKTSLDEDGNICSKCGWKAEGEHEVLPYEYECFCDDIFWSEQREIDPLYDRALCDEYAPGVDLSEEPDYYPTVEKLQESYYVDDDTAYRAEREGR